MTLVIAHRGASAAAPENTIEAFELAGALGADGVELDVRRTADDRLVVHHDPHLPDGRIVRHTRSGDLPDHVPSLDAALDACAGMFVNVEIKNAPDEPDDDPGHWAAHAVAALLTRRGSPRRWLVSSFRTGTVARVHRVAPTVRTALLCEALGDEELQHALAFGHHAVHPSVDGLTEAQVRAARSAGLAVNAWTCDDPDRIAELIAWGVDGICTNVPDVALAVRASVRGRDTGAVSGNVRWTGVAIDCADADELGAFYAAVLGWEITARDDGWLQLRDPGGGVGLNIQSEPGYAPPVWPERPGEQAKMMHFEVLVRDLDAAVASVVAAGGREAPDQPIDRDPRRLRVVLDPAGHPFCLFVEGE